MTLKDSPLGSLVLNFFWHRKCSSTPEAATTTQKQRRKTTKKYLRVSTWLRTQTLDPDLALPPLCPVAAFHLVWQLPADDHEVDCGPRSKQSWSTCTRGQHVIYNIMCVWQTMRESLRVSLVQRERNVLTIYIQRRSREREKGVKWKSSSSTEWDESPHLQLSLIMVFHFHISTTILTHSNAYFPSQRG